MHVAGTQTIDGVATTEYAGSVRAAEALKTLPASFRKAMAPELQVLGNGTISFHVWIDGQHHTNQLFLDDVRVPVQNLGEVLGQIGPHLSQGALVIDVSSVKNANAGEGRAEARAMLRGERHSTRARPVEQ